MAEDDDDDTFGEFSFASNFPNNDDDWGDFIKSPQQSKPSVSSASYSNNKSESPPLWVKPSGALPLSLFGDTDENNDRNLNFSNLYNQTPNGSDSKFTWRADPVSVENGFSSISDKKINHSNVLDSYQNSILIGGWNPEYNVATLASSALDLNAHKHEVNGEVATNNTAEYALATENLNFSNLYNQKSNSPDSHLGNGKDAVSIVNGLSLSSTKSDGSNMLDPSKSTDLFGGWNMEFNVESLPSSFLDTNGHKQESDVIVANTIAEFVSTFDDLNFVNVNTHTSNGHNSYFRNGVDSVSIQDGSSSSWKKKSDESNVFADQNDDLFGGWNLESNVKTLSSSTLDMNGQQDKFDGDDVFDDGGEDEWEFKDAHTEFRMDGDVNNKDLGMNRVFEEKAYSSGTVSGSNKFNTSQEMDVTSTQPTTVTPNDFFPDTNSKTGQGVNGILDTSSDAVSTEYDEDFGEFTAAPSETGSKQGENDTKFNDFKGALPLSIFGDEEQNSDGSSVVQDTFLNLSTPELRNNNPPTSVISVNDLISSLYSQQAEQPSSVGTVQNLTTIELNISKEVSSSNIVDDEDYLDNSSWDFKDASSEASLYSNSDLHLSISSKLKLNDYLDFCSKLKEELCCIAQGHIEILKQSLSTAALSDEDATVGALDSDLQIVCKELEQMNFLFEENCSQYHPSGDCCLNEFIEALLEPRFQKLESEYQLSAKLSLVEKDPVSAIELLKYVNTMLKILTIGTSDEQSTYISIWTNMMSVCAQELKHGALIWNQALEKNVETQLLVEPQGCKFILALGEIYRVVVVLGASAKLFKLWVLSCSEDSSGLYMFLEECHTVWSTSGLEDALSNVSARTASDGALILKSIKHISGLDTLTLENYLFTERDFLCRLSILTPGVAPGLNMIMWGEDQCLVTLANLWANLISSVPPKLPRLQIG